MSLPVLVQPHAAGLPSNVVGRKNWLNILGFLDEQTYPSRIVRENLGQFRRPYTDLIRVDYGVSCTAALRCLEKTLNVANQEPHNTSERAHVLWLCVWKACDEMGQ